MSSWLRNSMGMSKVGVPVSSTKWPLTQLKVAALVLDTMCIGPTDYNSRSGTSPLSFHRSSQKVIPSAKSKINKEKRRVKNVNTRIRTQVFRPPGQKHCHESRCSFPPRSKGLRVNGARALGLASLTIIYTISGCRSLLFCRVYCRWRDCRSLLFCAFCVYQIFPD